MKILLSLLFVSSCVYHGKKYTTINLDGSRSKILYGNGSGFIKSFKWRQIKGTQVPIKNVNSIITQTSTDSIGGAWELTGTDNLGNIDRDTFYYPKK